VRYDPHPLPFSHIRRRELGYGIVGDIRSFYLIVLKNYMVFQTILPSLDVGEGPRVRREK